MGLQGGCAGLRPKRGAENLAVLRFSGPAVLGRSPAQASDEVFVEVPHQELSFRFHAINDSILRIGGASEQRPYVRRAEERDALSPQPLALVSEAAYAGKCTR